MDIKQVMELLQYISGAYPRFEVNENTARVWYKFLKDCDYDQIMKKIDRHIENSNYPPTIAELKIKIPQNETPEEWVFTPPKTDKLWMFD